MNIEARNVCRRIDDLRRASGFSQEQLAGHLQISQPAISRYLRDRIPPAVVLLRLARLTGRTMEWILTGAENQTGYAVQGVREKEAVYRRADTLSIIRTDLPETVRAALLQLVRAIRPEED